MIAIIIPVHNRIRFTMNCLSSLKKQTIKEYTVIVVNDGSTDGTPERIAEAYPEVHILHGDGSLFWTASINKGIVFALNQGARYVVSLNNDTVVKADFLERMQEWAARKPEAIMGALALDAQSGRPVYGGAVLDWRSGTMRYLLDEIPPQEYTGLHKVNHFPGRGLWIPAAVFQKTGLFDEKAFPHYFADYDFTHKALQYGFQLYCNYDAAIYIFPEESGDRKNRRVKNFKNYYNHLFGIKGGGNLKNFTRFALRNCPNSYLPYYLINGYVRRVFGYLIK